jgi:hypothetical protein
MRTTVTIDPDVQQLIREAMQQTGHGFKTTLNAAVRKGLADLMPAKREKRFVVQAQDMGVCPGVDIANVHDIESELEVESYLNVTQKLRQRRASTAASKRRSKS